MKKSLISFLAILGFSNAVNALESGSNFLKIDSAARAVSMGSAYTALASGVEAISYNPSGLAMTKAVEVGFSHTNWLMGSKHDFIAAALPIKSIGAGDYREGWVGGLGITRLSNSSIEIRNADRSAGGSFTSYDQAVSVGLARASGRNRMGLGIKYLESYISGEKARGVAVDLGFSRALNTRRPITVGLAVQNLGSGMKFMRQSDPLPLSFAAGVSFSVVPGLNLALDAKRLVYDRQTSVSFGTEYAVLSGFALRSGYLSNSNTNSLKNNGFSAGVGFIFLKTNLDYSVTPYGELGNTQKISLKRSF